VGIFLFLVFVARSWVLYSADMSNVPAAQRFSMLLPSLFASLIYQHNLIFGQESFINFVAWSLEIEVQFYLLVPLLVGVFRIPSAMVRRVVLAAVCLVLVILQVLLAPVYPILHLTILGHLQYFLLGFLLADLFLVGGLR